MIHKVEYVWSDCTIHAKKYSSIFLNSTAFEWRLRWDVAPLVWLHPDVYSFSFTPTSGQLLQASCCSVHVVMSLCVCECVLWWQSPPGALAPSFSLLQLLEWYRANWEARVPPNRAGHSQGQSAHHRHFRVPFWFGLHHI